MVLAAHPFSIGGPAAASLLVNAFLIVSLLNLGMGRVSRRPQSPAITVMSLAVLKGKEQGEEEAETAVPSTPAALSPPPADPLLVPQPTALAVVAPPVFAMPSRLSLPMPIQPVAGPAASTTPAASQPARPAVLAAAPSAASPVRRGAGDPSFRSETSFQCLGPDRRLLGQIGEQMAWRLPAGQRRRSTWNWTSMAR